MKIRELIIQLLAEDLDQEICIETHHTTIRCAAPIEGIAAVNPSRYDGVLIVPCEPLYTEEQAKKEWGEQ